ncbi:MAG: hypothetical protein K2I14_03740, partial [Eubacterium sp.]|nr:hypothetical protein [Eubacterium sp.]
MKVNLKLLWVVLAFVSVAVISVSLFCDNNTDDASESESHSTSDTYTSTEAESVSEITEPLKIEVIPFNENELVFKFTADNLVDCFNATYKADNKQPFLNHIESWSSDLVSSTAHSEFETFCYQTKRDINNYNDSTISFYVPKQSNSLQYVN